MVGVGSDAHNCRRCRLTAEVLQCGNQEWVHFFSSLETAPRHLVGNISLVCSEKL